MHLKRVRVPDFRVLKDIDITFEPDLVPRIFPVGSLNGGGKSTLLQLIFTLLHCCVDESRIPYLQNVIDGFDIDTDLGRRDLSTINIVIENNNVELKFFCCNQVYLNSRIEPQIEANNNCIGLVELVKLKKKIHSDYGDIQSIITNLNRLRPRNISRRGKYTFEDENISDRYREFLILELASILKTNIIKENEVFYSKFKHTILKVENHNFSIIEYEEAIESIIDFIKSHIRLLKKPHENNHGQIQKSWLNEKYCYICTLDTETEDNLVFLICEFQSSIPTDFIDILTSIKQNIFLAAPITQVFRFLEKSDRSLLFKGGELSKKYYSQLEKAKSELPGFFAYDFLAVELLIKALLKARDDDFRVANANGGGQDYGNSYQQLFKNITRMLGDKQISIEGDFTGVRFSKVEDNGNIIELYPDDFSHGELKRLSLYMWLKFNEIKDAIVLMDEVEIALHPDWQYQIVNDLQTWAPNNQYILATHSYELCQALTPAHVKEIEPKLLIKKP